jgi:hypothetical protein
MLSTFEEDICTTCIYNDPQAKYKAKLLKQGQFLLRMKKEVATIKLLSEATDEN